MSTDSRRSVQHPGLVLAAMTLANAMVLVDQTAVPLTLPEIMRHYDVGSQMVQWVLNGSLVTLAALLVLGGQLGDLLGDVSSSSGPSLSRAGHAHAGVLVILGLVIKILTSTDGVPALAQHSAMPCCTPRS